MIDIHQTNTHTFLITFEPNWTSVELLRAVQDTAAIAVRTFGKKFVIADLTEASQLPTDLFSYFPEIAKARAPHYIVSRRLAIVTHQPWVFSLNACLFAKVYDQSFAYFGTVEEAKAAVDRWSEVLSTGILPPNVSQDTGFSAAQ